MHDSLDNLCANGSVCLDQFLSGKVRHSRFPYAPSQTTNTIVNTKTNTNSNPQTNLRTDAYGGTPEKRARFILEILSQTRKVVPATFAIGIKLNSADHSSATFEETMTQIALLAEAGIDFMEISGGSYEDPKMMGYGKANAATAPKSSRTAAREAFFLEFSKEVRQRHPGLVLMLTGGFRTRAGAEAAIRDNACDLVGIGRPAAIDPKFPRLLLDESVGDGEAQMLLNKVAVPWYVRFLPLHLIGAGAESVSSFFFPGGVNMSSLLMSLIDVLFCADSEIGEGDCCYCASLVKRLLGKFCICINACSVLFWCNNSFDLE